MTARLIINGAAAFAALGAAALWLWSTAPKLPEKFTSPYSAPPPELKDMREALARQSQRNAAAAVLAAIAAVLQGIGTLL